LVNSCLTLSIVTGMSVSDVSQKTVANLGWDKIRLSAPVFAGDTIYAESEVIGKRESASRAHHGIVTVRTTGKKADGTVFLRFELRLLDDASSAPRNAQLYDELIRDKADALIGPYGSAASLMAAAEAERARRVIVNGSAPARALHRRAPRYVFQASVPYSAF